MNMSDPDPTFNLTALSDRLFAEKRLLPLVGKIRRARDLHSLSTDLVMALESLDALDVLFNSPSAGGDYIRTATESALLNNALVLYVRATKTTSKQRGGFDLDFKFSDEEKVVHKELADLRDHAIAHFGSGGSYAGEWQAELVIMQFNGERAKPGVVTRRQMVDGNLAKRARKQIEVALALLRGLALEKLGEVTDEINKAFADDPEFHKEYGRHPLNFDIFLTSDVAGQEARSSFDQVYAMGIVTRA
jgi:hypothetical protein